MTSIAVGIRWILQGIINSALDRVVRFPRSVHLKDFYVNTFYGPFFKRKSTARVRLFKKALLRFQVGVVVGLDHEMTGWI